MAIIRPTARRRIVPGIYKTSNASAEIAVQTDGSSVPVRLEIEGQWFGKSDLIDLRDLLNEFIEAL